MKTLIRLEEQSDLGLHCLPKPICPKTSDHYSIGMSFDNVNEYFSSLDEKTF